jgi:hypothetical protein
MNFRDISRYSWFANMAYVEWDRSSNSSNNDYNGTKTAMIDAASNKDAQRAPEELAK